MSKSIPDVFHAFLVEDANFDGSYEIPILKGCCEIPTRVIPFSKALFSKEYDAWVVFYEHDTKFIRIWNNPDQYIPILKRFKGIVSPDFSLYRNMPLAMQIWSTYQGKAFAHFCEGNGIPVIPNVRFSDSRSFDFCFAGVPRNSVVAVGTHGCIKSKLDRKYFKDGLSKLIKVVTPHTILVYGAAPEEVFSECRKHGIDIVQFDSETSLYHRNKKAVV